MITFNEFFEDPDAKKLIEHIVKTIDPGGENTQFVIDYEGKTIELLVVRGTPKTGSYREFTQLMLQKGFWTKNDYILVQSQDRAYAERVYIRTPEILSHHEVVNFLKEFVK